MDTWLEQRGVVIYLRVGRKVLGNLGLAGATELADANLAESSGYGDSFKIDFDAVTWDWVDDLVIESNIESLEAPLEFENV